MQTSPSDTDEAVARFASIVDGLEDPLTILELGACDGLHTKLLRNAIHGRDFRFVATEPDPRNFVKLCESGAADRNTYLQDKAIGAQNGVQLLYLSSGGDYYGSSSLRKPTGALDLPGIRFDDHAVVEVMTLDRFAGCHLNEWRPIDFIWADIQGSEGDMVAGGQWALKMTRWLYVEADKGMYEGDVGEDDLLAMLPDWKSHGRVGGDLLLENTKL